MKRKSYRVVRRKYAAWVIRMIYKTPVVITKGGEDSGGLLRADGI